jgi:chemotaxis protein methyltransferase CheR
MGADPGGTELEDLEIALLLEGIYQRYGFDFRSYAAASLKRRIVHSVREEGLPSISRLQERVLHDPASMQRLLANLSVNTTSMYRDPDFYRSFREKVVPALRTYPFVRIWLAGCAAGQEVYSMAILLHEEDLYDRCRLYATDMNDALLDNARSGAYPLGAMQEYTRNYQQAGGQRAFSEYYSAHFDRAIFQPWLQENIVWAQHNLVIDGVFNTFHAILCRNVMIYFSRPLQAHVHQLLYDSLEPFGVLGLGNRESLQLTVLADCFSVLDSNARLYRKVK